MTRAAGDGIAAMSRRAPQIHGGRLREEFSRCRSLLQVGRRVRQSHRRQGNRRRACRSVVARSPGRPQAFRLSQRGVRLAHPRRAAVDETPRRRHPALRDSELGVGTQQITQRLNHPARPWRPRGHPRRSRPRPTTEGQSGARLETPQEDPRGARLPLARPGQRAGRHLSIPDDHLHPRLHRPAVGRGDGACGSGTSTSNADA